MERDQLVQRKDPLRRHSAYSRQRLYPLAGERTSEQRRYRILSESPERSARLGNHLQHAFSHILRILQSDSVGIHRRDAEAAWLPGSVLRNSLDRFGLHRFFHTLPSVLQRKDQLANSVAGAAALSCVPARQTLAIRSCDSASCSAGDCRRHRVHIGFEIIRRNSQLWGNARIFTGDLLWRSHAWADALRGDPLLGPAVPRQAGANDSLRACHAQFLPFLQCRSRLAISPAGYSRDVRIAA